MNGRFVRELDFKLCGFTSGPLNFSPSSSRSLSCAMRSVLLDPRLRALGIVTGVAEEAVTLNIGSNSEDDILRMKCN